MVQVYYLIFKLNKGVQKYEGLKFTNQTLLKWLQFKM